MVGLMATYDHGFLVLVSLIAGVMLMVTGIVRLGRVVAMDWMRQTLFQKCSIFLK